MYIMQKALSNFYAEKDNYPIKRLPQSKNTLHKKTARLKIKVDRFVSLGKTTEN
jgi:hypothetical protein